MSRKERAEEVVYLDHAAATPVRLAVREMYSSLCEQYYANPHATSWLSEESRIAIDRAERKLLSLFNLSPTRFAITWTSGGTEAMNLGCLGTMRQFEHGICLQEATAHNAVREACRSTGRCQIVPVGPDGNPDLERIATEPDEVRLFATGHVNNETGSIIDLAALRGWMRRAAPASLMLVDAVQSFGKIDIPCTESDPDLLIVSGRKIGGPAQVGALIRKKTIKLKPLFFGGGQQKGLRPGTLDTVGILMFIKAAEMSVAEQEANYQHVKQLNCELRIDLCKKFNNVMILSPENASPYILNIAFPGYEGAVLMRALAEKRVIVATGSACSAESKEVSQVLSAMGFSKKVARGALRISFSGSTVEQDIQALLEALRQVLDQY